MTCTEIITTTNTSTANTNTGSSTTVTNRLIPVKYLAIVPRERFSHFTSTSGITTITTGITTITGGITAIGSGIGYILFLSGIYIVIPDTASTSITRSISSISIVGTHQRTGIDRN